MRFSTFVLVTAFIALGLPVSADTPTVAQVLFCARVVVSGDGIGPGDLAKIRISLRDAGNAVLAISTPSQTVDLSRTCWRSAPAVSPGGNGAILAGVLFSRQVPAPVGGGTVTAPTPLAASTVTFACSYDDIVVPCTWSRFVFPGVHRAIRIRVPHASYVTTLAPTFAGPIAYATDQKPSGLPSIFSNERPATTIAECGDVTGPPSPSCYMSYGDVAIDTGDTHLTSIGDLRRWISDNYPSATRVVIFVHGFNENFSNSIKDARLLSAYLANRTEPAIPVVSYGWPARASDFGLPFGLAHYPDDEANNAWSDAHFAWFLQSLLDSDPTRPLDISIVAHSMGNRLMLDGTSYLRTQTRTSQPPGLPCPQRPAAGNYCGRIRQLIAIEPDVDMQTFGESAWRLLDFVSSITVYGSTVDVALNGSRTLHGHCRAGQLDCDAVFPELPNMNVIDASMFTKCDPDIHHSYWEGSSTVLRDIVTLLRAETPMTEQTPRSHLTFDSSPPRGRWTPRAPARPKVPHFSFTGRDSDDTCA